MSVQQDKYTSHSALTESHPLFKALSKPIYDQSISSVMNMINFIAEGIFIANQQGVIEAVNPLTEQFFGQPRDNLIGQNWLRFLHVNCKEKYEYSLATWFEQEGDARDQFGPNEILIQRDDGTWLEADLSISSLAGMSKQTDNLVVGVLHNLTEHKKQLSNLRRQAYTDHLTGLANRYALDQMLQNTWYQCKMKAVSVGLIIIDVDYFKNINDQYGHVCGDKCLRKIAEVLEAYLPTRNCMAARYGGEEFALILPNCDIQQAQGIAGLIQYKIANLDLSEFGLPVTQRITVSQGIACELGGKYMTSESLICAADTAVYQAKSSGRNKIMLAD